MAHPVVNGNLKQDRTACLYQAGQLNFKRKKAPAVLCGRLSVDIDNGMMSNSIKAKDQALG